MFGAERQQRQGGAASEPPTPRLDPAPALPPQVPMARAAEAPIGADSTTAVSRSVDTLAVVVAPLLVPAAVLAIARTGPGRPFVHSFSLTDIAFGVVAVAFAALTRALTGKRSSWKLVTAIGIGAIVFETAIAIAKDEIPNTDRLAEEAQKCPAHCNTDVIRDLGANIAQGAPVAFHWIVALSVGAILCTLTVLTIWTD